VDTFELTFLGEAYIWLQKKKSAAMANIESLDFAERCIKIESLLQEHPDKLYLDLTPDDYLELASIFGLE